MAINATPSAHGVIRKERFLCQYELRRATGRLDGFNRASGGAASTGREASGGFRHRKNSQPALIP
jgi:hypothetical protein